MYTRNIFLQNVFLEEKTFSFNIYLIHLLDIFILKYLNDHFNKINFYTN